MPTVHPPLITPISPELPPARHQSLRAPTVPLAIWLCAPTPAEQGGLPLLVDGVSRSLITRIVEEFSRPDDIVVVTGVDSGRIAAVADACGQRRATTWPRPATTLGDRTTGGDHHRDVPARTAGGALAASVAPRSAGLVLAVELPIPWITPTGQPYRDWAGLLRPGGVLAVITANPAGPGRFANHTGMVVAAAEDAGLGYLQHIVAVHAHVHGERLLVPTSTDHTQPELGTAEYVHVPAHTDLVIFTMAEGGLR
jgi:hypothetical protein